MVLLDTHILLWMLFDDSKLTPQAIEALNNHKCILSMASIWELAIKMSLGKLNLPKTLREIVKTCDNMGIDIVDVSLDDCMCLLNLPWIHRDPFDRMIIAHGITHNIPLITHDSNIRRYDSLNIIW